MKSQFNAIQIKTISNLMIGLNYQEVFTLVLSSRQDQFKNMNLEELK